MKLAAIKKQCMKAKEIVIFEDGEKQWLGTYSACWPVENMRLTKESVIELFDLKPKQVADVDMNVIPMEGTGLLGDPNAAEELRDLMIVMWHGKRLRLMCTKEGKIYAIDDEKICTSCSEKDYRGVTIQRGSTGMPVARVSNGFICCGIIAPEARGDTDEILRMMEHMLIPNTYALRKEEDDEEMEAE